MTVEATLDQQLVASTVQVTRELFVSQGCLQSAQRHRVEPANCTSKGLNSGGTIKRYTTKGELKGQDETADRILIANRGSRTGHRNRNFERLKRL